MQNLIEMLNEIQEIRAHLNLLEDRIQQECKLHPILTKDEVAIMMQFQKDSLIARDGLDESALNALIQKGYIQATICHTVLNGSIPMVRITELGKERLVELLSGEQV